MPIVRIGEQPIIGGLLAAYRPVVLKVEAAATTGTKPPPYVVCDIYIRDVYYKSMLRTAPENIGANSAIYSFDISEALQEYLQPDIASVTNDQLLPAMHMSAMVYCRFRSSGVDIDGFTVEEGTKPVQATKFTAAVSGNGTESNTFFVINSALQHEDNPNLGTHLATFRQGTWDAKAYPLTHRNRYFFTEGSSDHFPFIYAGDCLQADIQLCYRLRGETTFNCGDGPVDTNPCNAIGYTTEVIGNTVNVHLASAPVSGGKVATRYRIQGNPTWITGPNSTAKDYSFAVDAPGTYDIEVTTYCSCCTNAAPVVHSFIVDEVVQNLGWRGIDPFCVEDPLSGDIYVKLTYSNANINTQYYPNSTFYYQKTVLETSDMTASFFSDASFLTPLSVIQSGLKITVKKHLQIFDGTNLFDQEGLLSYTVDASGTSALLGNVTTRDVTTNYDVTDTSIQTGYIEKDYTYFVYPFAKLMSGFTGYQGYNTLQEYNTDNNLPTGVTKPNVASDPDYIAPISNGAACPSVLPFINVTYGYNLEVAKVELRQGSSSIYATPVNSTGTGNINYILYEPRGIDTYVTVKAKTLDSSNTTGNIKVKVQLEDNSSQSFDVPNNIETQLPVAFKNITVISISNF